MKLIFSCFFMICTLVGFSQEDKEQSEYVKQMAVRTAKQTWWFFQYRLNHPLPDYKFFRIHHSIQNIWIKDMKQQQDGSYIGVVDDKMPGAQPGGGQITFDSVVVDDWMFVDDYYLVGGYSLWNKTFTERKPYMKAGQFRFSTSCMNDDFIELSRVLPEQDTMYYLETEYMFNKRYEGGINAFYQTLFKELKYPVYAIEMGIEGFITVSFKLTREGKAEKIKVLRGVGGGLNEEVKDVLWNLKDSFIPDATAEDIIITLPVRFTFRD